MTPNLVTGQLQSYCQGGDGGGKICGIISNTEQDGNYFIIITKLNCVGDGG